jgi:NAD(P)H-dependent flavin oxidoreductase YrpB (nitropropane dioxygenase family)
MVENGISIGPELIQGGMGVGVSSWELARAVALAGEIVDRQVLGVVSGTGLPILMVGKLGRKDPDTIRALQAFPVPEIAQGILDRYTGSRKPPPKPQVLLNGSEVTKLLMADLSVVANFAEVWLAKEGHHQPIGINYLEKIQLTHLPEMYGAMLAGVDYVLMGAGIPNQVPNILDRFAHNQQATYRIDVEDFADKYEMSFNPSRYNPIKVQHELKRPKFLAIVSSHVLAQVLINKVEGVDGFVVEGPIAGGHNSPARGKELNEQGEPIYGVKDKPDLGKILELQRPFWLAGGFADPKKLREAKENGANGIQVGSAFALCEESGLNNDLKRELRQKSFDGSLVVVASADASPSGFPFQVVQMDGTVSDSNVYDAKKRVCTYGYLVRPFMNGGGKIDFRCPAEPIDVFVRKGGKLEETEGRRCLCVGLSAAVNQARDGEPAIVTLGKDNSFARKLMQTPNDTFSAENVVKFILGK